MDSSMTLRDRPKRLAAKHPLDRNRKGARNYFAKAMECAKRFIHGVAHLLISPYQ